MPDSLGVDRTLTLLYIFLKTIREGPFDASDKPAADLELDVPDLNYYIRAKTFY